MDKIDKAKKLIEDDRVFFKGKTGNKEYYIVNGFSGEIREVVVDLIGDEFHCPCPNIRFDTCYHIEGVKLFRGDLNG